MKNHTLIFLFLPFVLTFILSSCNEDKKETSDKENASKSVEGQIYYSITYPNLDESQGYVSAIVPRNMLFIIKDDKFKSSISRGNMFSLVMIGKPQEDFLGVGLEFGTENIMTVLSGKEISHFKNDQPPFTLKDTDKTKEMAGFLCKKKIATYQTDSSSINFDVWYTNDIELKNSNWFTPYEQIQGVLMAYEVEYYGLRMRFEAEEFKEMEVNDDTFKVDSKFKNISYGKFDKRLHQIFDQLLHL